ncbi:MAG: putative phage abortive infection protein [Candidatus Pristimantibacillus sp.]
METTKSKFEWKPINTFLLIAIVTVFYGLIIKYVLFKNVSWTNSGEFGDTFGALNTLFSGLAFAGIITTILIQQKQIKDQNDNNKLQFLKERHQYLIGQIKAWPQYNKFNHKNFFQANEIGLTKQESYPKIIYNTGQDCTHLTDMIKTTIEFISEHYVPANPYVKPETETQMLINIMKNKISQNDLIVLGIHAIQSKDQDLIDYINKYFLFEFVTKDILSKYPLTNTLFHSHGFLTWNKKYKPD